MLNALMTFFGFEKLEAFVLAAPALLLFSLTLIFASLRAPVVIVNWFQKKEIVLSELVLARKETPFEMSVQFSIISCCILAVIGGSACLLGAFDCDEGDSRDRDCLLSRYSSWLASHHGTQHWWQMMGDVLWLIILSGVLCLAVWVAWLIIRSMWRYVLQPLLVAVWKYGRQFKIKL